MDTCFLCFFFQAEDGIRDLVRSRGLGDVYKRQLVRLNLQARGQMVFEHPRHHFVGALPAVNR